MNNDIDEKCLAEFKNWFLQKYKCSVKDKEWAGVLEHYDVWPAYQAAWQTRAQPPALPDAPARVLEKSQDGELAARIQCIEIDSYPPDTLFIPVHKITLNMLIQSSQRDNECPGLPHCWKGKSIGDALKTYKALVGDKAEQREVTGEVVEALKHYARKEDLLTQSMADNPVFGKSYENLLGKSKAHKALASISGEGE